MRAFKCLLVKRQADRAMRITSSEPVSTPYLIYIVNDGETPAGFSP
jgi:hypothetical protein